MRKRNVAGNPKKTCSKCGGELETNRQGKQRYCLSCHNLANRISRTKHSDLPDEARKRANARSYLHVYIRRGKIQKQPCMFCGSEPAQAHHHDYDKPLDVVWLCKAHHGLLHEFHNNILQ